MCTRACLRSCSESILCLQKFVVLTVKKLEKVKKLFWKVSKYRSPYSNECLRVFQLKIHSWLDLQTDSLHLTNAPSFSPNKTLQIRDSTKRSIQPEQSTLSYYFLQRWRRKANSQLPLLNLPNPPPRPPHPRNTDRHPQARYARLKMRNKSFYPFGTTMWIRLHNG